LSGSRSGFVLLDKPEGMTSFQALRAVKTGAGTRRVGHAGTLDRFATGLLVVLVGSATRLARLFNDLDKSYRAVVRFGAETDTLDPEGRVVATGPVPDLSRVELAARGLVGRIEQVPPVFSALHVGGRRAHELARAGSPPEMAPRTVHVHALRLRRYEPPELEIEVECSKGTYVRSLARDLGRAAGSRAHLRSLRRTEVGPFGVAEAVNPLEFDPLRHTLPAGGVLPRLPGVRSRSVDAEAAIAVRHGRPLGVASTMGVEAGEEVLVLFGPGGGLIAVARREDTRYRYLAVFDEDPE
jgi:tRNA pseudouridine55 synthase